LGCDDLEGVGWKMPFKVNARIAQIRQSNSAKLGFYWGERSVRVKRGKYLKLSTLLLGLGLLSLWRGAIGKLANEGLVTFEEPLVNRGRPPALEQVRIGV
jgi:hypothetical protein